jgi:hypothetical protein
MEYTLADITATCRTLPCWAVAKQVWIGRNFRRREGVSPDDQLANFRLYAG